MSRTPRLSPRACRAAWVVSCLVFAVCVLACMRAPFKARADYGSGLEFRADEDRDAFNEIHWSDPDLRQPVCPVVVHTPGGDIGDAQLQPPKALLDAGGVVRIDDNKAGQPRVVAVEFTRGGATLDAFYRNDRITSLRVRVSAPTPITLDGKRVTLPLSKAELIGTFGQPKLMVE